MERPLERFSLNNCSRNSSLLQHACIDNKFVGINSRGTAKTTNVYTLEISISNENRVIGFLAGFCLLCTCVLCETDIYCQFSTGARLKRVGGQGLD